MTSREQTGSRAQAASPDRQPDTRHLGRSEIGPRELGLFQQVWLPTFISNPAGCNVFPHCILGTTFFSGLARDTQRHWGGTHRCWAILNRPRSAGAAVISKSPPRFSRQTFQLSLRAATSQGACKVLQPGGGRALSGDGRVTTSSEGRAYVLPV